MNLPDDAPKLSPWPFLVGDAVLIGVAALIAARSPAPLTGASLIVIALCVGLGAVLACIPFLLNYTRRQDIALAERQREIAALARTTAESAEQLGIVAQGLHTVTELTNRTLKHADQLPQKVQEKINEFKAQLNEVAVTENETLAQEVNTLRTSETERLETALASVRKTVAELSALETTTRRHLGEITQTLASFHSAAEAATTARHSALERGIATTLADFENRLAALVATATRNHSPATPTPPTATEAHAATPSPAPVPVSAAELKSTPSASPFVPASAPSQPPFPPANEVVNTASTTPLSPGESAAPMRKRPPKKTAVRDDDQPSLGLDLPPASPNDEYSQSAPEDSDPAPALSSDGLTRLLVTAYIGIGNKLFVRGDGPGLSLEKGVPLQFVSIGKWRWETPDAVAPFTLKLFKNDEEECTALGELTLEPGHQHEVRASF